MWVYMAGRYQMPRQREDFRAIEDELRANQREIEMFLAENRILVQDNTLIKRELLATKHEIHELGQSIPTLRAQKGAGERELIERELRLKADLRAAEPLKMEIAQLRAQAFNLNSTRLDLGKQIQGLTKLVKQFKADSQNLVLMRTEVELLDQKLAEARKDLEYEKKAKEEQAEQKESIEKNILFMVDQIQKLKEQLNDIRRASDSGGYERLNGSWEMSYSGTWEHHYGNYDLARR